MRRAAYYLAIALVFMVPWEAALQFGPIGRGTKLLGLTAGVVWLLSVVSRGRMRTPDTFHKSYFLLLTWSALTFYWSIVPGTTWRGVITYAQLFVMMLMLWDLLDSRKRVETAAQAYVLGAFVTSGNIIANYLTATPGRFPAHERVNALGYQTDGIALIVAIAGPAAWYLAAGPTGIRRRFALRVLNFAYVPIGLMALVLTGTRGATLASIPTVLLILWSLRNASGAVRGMALAAVVCAVVLVAEYAPRGQLARIGTATTASEFGEEGGALSGRWSIWRESLKVWVQHPIVGVGVDSHRAAVAPAIESRTIYKASEKEAHNTYISVLTEMGVVGAFLFGAVLLSAFARLRQLCGWDRAYWSAQVAVLMIGAMSLSLEDSKSVWIFLSLVVAAAAASRMQTAAEATTAGAPTKRSFALPTRLESLGR